MKLKLPIRIAGLVALIAAGVTALTLAGPGSGTATISPSANVTAGASGEWSIVYTAAETHDDGTVRLTIPSEWTAPQDGSNSSPGFVTVSTDEPTGSPSLSVAGHVITVAVDTLNAGNSITIVYGDDSSSASARATAATTVGSYTFAVASDPSGGSVSSLSSSPAITVIATTPASLDIVPDDTTGVAAGSFVQMHVRVLDTFGNRAPVASNRTVNLFATHGQFFDPSNHSTPITSIVIASGSNVKRVDYRGTIVAGSPHTINAFTSGGSPSLGGSDFVSLVPAAMNATQSTIAATSPVVADGAAQSTVTVTSRDAFGNPREDDTVLIDATGSATDADPGSPTDVNGEAVGAVANTIAEIVTVSATINGAAVLSGNPPVTFVAGPVSAVNSIVNASTPVIANGAATSTITVTARDANNNPVAGQAVVLSVAPPGNMTLTQPSGVTGPNGQINGTLASTVIGPRTVTAQIGATPVTDDAVIQFTAGTIASFQWTVDGASTAGAFENVTLRVRDAQGNTVTNYTGTVNLSTTTGGSGDGVVQWDAVTPDAHGVLTNQSEDDATYQFVASDNGVAILRVTNTRAETFQVRAVDGAVNQNSGNIVNTHASADKIEIVSGNGQTATVQSAVSSAPTVRVRDQFDNTVDGAQVTFTRLTPNGFVDAIAGGGLDSTVTTAANGEIDCDVWRMSTTAGLNRLRARIPSGSVAAVFFTATGTPGNGANLDVAPNSQSVTQGTSFVVSATLTDSFGNVKSGDVVTVAITDAPNGSLASNPADPNPTNTINAFTRSGTTDANGRITVLYNAPGGASLADVIDASSATVTQSSVVDATYTTVASGGTNLRITFVGGSTRPANDTFQFLVEAVDGNGNVDTGNNANVTLTPEAGGNVTFSLSDFGTTITQAQLQNGARTIYGKGTVAGDWDITAVGGGLGTDIEVVTITDTGEVDHYFVSSPTPITAGAAFNVTVEARDQYNNRVMGANNAVTLQAYNAAGTAPATSTLLVPSANLVGGSVIVAQQYTKAETIRVRVSSGAPEGFSSQVIVNAAPAHRIAKVSGDASNVVAGGTQILVAQVLDQFDNPVNGQTVTFAQLTGGGSPSPPTAITSPSGQAQTTFTTGTTVGSNTIKATILDESPAGLERVDYSVTTIPGPVASFQVVPASLTLTAGVSVGLTVTGLDANANVVTNDDTTPIQLTENGNATFGAATGLLTDGVFNTTVSDNVAETFTITAQRQGGGASGASALVTVTHAGAYQVTKVTVDPINGVPVGANQALEVLVRDAFNNPVPNALVTFATTGVINDGSFTDGTGDPNDGIVATLANGHATVTFTTSPTVGANNVNATILDGTPPAQERVTFVVNTVAGGIAYYTVQMNFTTATAGQNRNVTITAFDASNNPVDDDATQVDLLEDLGTGLIFGADPVTLSNGVAVTTVRSNLAQDYRVRARSVGNAAITGVGQTVTVSPALPAGTISGTPDPATITANGVSVSSITSSEITDAFGNRVPVGTQVTVSTNRGTIVPAGTKLVNTNGQIEFDLRSSTSPGLATVTMTSLQGTATGTVNVTFAPPPTFVSNQFPNIRVTTPGANVAFTVQVQNTSSTDANLTTGTTFTFTDGVRTFSANLASPTTILGPSTQTLAFASTVVDPAFTPAYYAPNVNLVGADEFNAPISAMTTLPAQSVLVTSIQITEVQPLQAIVSRGQSTQVIVKVKNNGAQSASITNINLDFNPNGDYVVSPALEVPLTLGPGVEGSFHVPVLVQAACPPGQYDIDASAVGNVSGNTVTDNAVAPFPLGSWTVVTAANLSYVAASMTPMSVSKGDAYQLRATIANGGQGIVSLDSSLTYIRFTDGTRVYQARPTQPYAIAGGAQQQIVFKTRAVANAFTTGAYVATFNLEGLESGAPFQQTVTSGADQIAVQTPAAVGATTVTPNQVTKGSSVPFSVQVSNSGTASVVLTPASTKFRFANPQFSADLDPNAVTTIPPGGATLVFLSTPVSNAIAANTYAGQLVLVGTENGNAFSQTLATNNVAVQNAPDVQVMAALSSRPVITTDQALPFKVRMVVRNNNGSDVTFTSASIKFVHGGNDRTPQFTISTPSSFVGGATLTGGEVDTVLFNVADNPGNAMSPGMMTIQGTVNVEEVNSGDPITAQNTLGGFLQVQTPATITLRSVLPSQPKVTKSMTKAFVVRAVVENTGGSDVDLDLTEPNTTLTFAPQPGWEFDVRPNLGNGGHLLGGSAIDTVLFDVTQSGNTSGTVGLDGTVRGIEVNSNRIFNGSSSGATTVQVQEAGDIDVTSVVSSRSTITNGAAVPWTLTVTLHNPGESDVDLAALATNITVSFQDATAAPVYNVPATLAGGGTILSGGETDQVVIAVNSAGTYGTLGAKNITVNADGTELNSGETRSGSGLTPVTVQGEPDLGFVSIVPSTVSRGSSVSFAVTIANNAPAATGATATLDRGNTRLSFGGGLYNVNLQPASPVDVPAGAQRTLLFNSSVISPSIPTGLQADAELAFDWEDNGRADTDTELIPNQITVQAAPDLSIVSVRPSRTTVTAGQAGAWTITMVVQNTNGAGVDLDLSPAMTRLQLNVLGGANVTNEYTITPPTALESAGNEILAGGAVDSLIFDVTQAGNTPGTIIVSGFVAGIDLNSQSPVSDNTVDGGSGSFALQTPGVLNILSTTSPRATATTGQTANYVIKMAVRNDGQSAIDLDLQLPTSTDLAFTPSSGWATTVQPSLIGGGVRLSGGETDTVVFNVTTTGSTPGVATITGTVAGTEFNTGTARSDNTASGGTGTITLQTPANIVINSATPSTPTLTSGAAVPWSITVSVSNTGQSDARLLLPPGLSFNISGATSASFNPVNFLQEGGVVLAGGATGTLVATANSAPTFNAFGSRAIGVTLNAVEINSGRAESGTDSNAGTVIAQTLPNLTVALLNTPTIVTRGSQALLQVEVTNPGANSATVVLDRNNTRVSFGGGPTFSAFMDASSPVVIAAGQTVSIFFEDKLVDNAFTPALYNLNVDLAYTENGDAKTELEVVANGISVQSPPQFRITAIDASVTNVTAGQTTDWTVTMTIENNGSADIDLTLAQAQTWVQFRAGAVTDPSYTVVQPTQLVGGGVRLEAGSTDQLVFTITQTGTVPGFIIINGRVQGTDVIQQTTVFDDTFDGGRGSVNVQPGAAVAILATRPSQPELTAGQNGWTVRVVLANTGGSDVAIDLALPTRVIFDGARPGWGYGAVQLLGGGNILEGGAVDSLAFTVSSAATQAGAHQIDAIVHFTELNTSAIDSVSTAPSGNFGSVKVETQPRLRITTAVVDAPNPNAVNTGQAFNLRIQVQNLGQADARDVAIAAQKTGNSQITASTTIPEVGGLQTVVHDIPATGAATTEPNARFWADITSAIDENSGRPEFVTLSANQDSSETIPIQSRAQFAVTHVRPSQATVTRSQNTPWNVFVRVRNDGQSAAVLTPPAANDLVFAIAGSTQVGYVVQPPTAFASARPGWNLDGGSIDSLMYTINVTGPNEGLVDITATLDGSDRNDPTVTFSENATGNVNVQAPAGFAIQSTIPVGTFNHEDADRDTVNTGFNYQIHVTVNNTGEAVDSLLVVLTSNLIPTQRSTILSSLIKQQLGVDDSYTFIFRITAAENPVNLETFTATIQPGVKSHNTGLTVTPQAPIDRLHQTTIQRPANLAINLSSVSGAVSPNQVFQMSAVVTNSGQAGVTGPAEVTIALPTGFAFEGPGESATKPFAIGTPVTWLVRAPNFQTLGDFASSISTTPLDRNTGAAANVSQATDNFPINVTTGGGLSAPQIQIATPAGARDNIVSDSQTFTVVDSVYATDDTDNVTATLSVPAGFSIVGSDTRGLGDGNNSLLGSVNPFTIIAPSTPGTADIYVTFTGVDANTQQPIPSVADTITVTTVARAALTTSAVVTAPPEATDNTVNVGTTFTVSARVDNAINAAGIASPGTLTISLPNGYVLNGVEPAVKPFSLGDPVTWQVDAPQQPSGPQQISVTISTVPPDENSGQPAILVDPNASIAMVTEGSAVAVRDVSANLGIDVGPVPAGTRDIRMLGFEIAYNVSDPSVADARIDSIAVTIIGPDGSPLGPGTVGNTLQKLSIDIGGPAPVDVFDPSSNPVVVSFLSLGPAAERMIAPDAARNAIVSVSLYPNPTAKEFSVGLRSGGVCVRDSQSNQRLGVTDANGQPLDGNITSDPLIVRTSSFEEYVYNYPNPFRAGAQDTRIAYVMDQPGSVSVRIFAIDGSLVYEESIPAGDARAQAGPQETTWDGRNGKGEVVRNGVYVCVLNAGGRSAKFRIAVAK